MPPKTIPTVERRSLCLPSAEPGIAAHFGELGFEDSLNKYVPSPESTAAEKLVQLKDELKTADTETFWSRLMEGMTEICSSQYAFVAKRILVDDHDAAVEMPPLGEPGSCLMGVAFYYNDGKVKKAMMRDWRYLAWGAPCGYMRHDKVFLIPENMSTFIANNPNALPFPAEGYLGVPLFSGGKCFAHFGMMWTQEGLDQKAVSWGYIEMIMHSLEDLINERLLSGRGFAKTGSGSESRAPPPDLAAVIPQAAINAAQSLKPYARSLSHELRTPMQGVVGMLDVMHATVSEQIEGQSNDKIRHIFRSLRDNIEVVQDSSKRAVEAADNVVHAYDMNMQVPETPQDDTDSPARGLSIARNGSFENRPPQNILIESFNPYKRRRSSPSWQFGNPTKLRHVQAPASRETSPRSEEVKSAVAQREAMIDYAMDDTSHTQAPVEESRAHKRGTAARFTVDPDTAPTSGLRQTTIRELIPVVINEALRVGGRPDSAISEPTTHGERIEVRTRSSSGHTSQRTIDWVVEPDVPESLLVDERDVAKLVSAVFLNAVKFTENGNILITTRLSKNQRLVVINVRDTGDGIPKEFLPELFKPFSREDDSLTRTKEGLGLGLLVAKGLARRIGGDITLLHSQISGPNKGSEFEIKIPLDSADTASRATTPYRQTPEPPSKQSRQPTSAPARQTPPRSPELRSSPLREYASTPTITSLTGGQPNGPLARRTSTTPRSTKTSKNTYDRALAEKHPLTILVAEDNKLNRRLVVSMLAKLGYKDVYEAFDGKEAVRIMDEVYKSQVNGRRVRDGSTRPKGVDVVLMDLWMPEMDGYEATERILGMFDKLPIKCQAPTILAVSADVTDEAIARATKIGMEGFMTKPFKLIDLQRLILGFCVKDHNGNGVEVA